MPALHVVFDTNVYRGLSSASFEHLRSLERGNSVQPLASYFAAAELLAHLSDGEETAFQIAHSSLKRLWVHAKTYDGSREVLNFIADSDNQLAHVLFGRHLPGRPDEALTYGTLVGEVANFPKEDIRTKLGASLAKVSEHVASTEEAFATGLWKYVVLPLVPGATTWKDITEPTAFRAELLRRIADGAGRPLMARAVVAKVAGLLNISIAEGELDRLADLVQTHFPLALRFYDKVVQGILEHGVDMTKKARANSIWDLHISFSTGVGANIQGAPLWIITDDNLLLDAAAAAGQSGRVMRRADYESILQLDWCAFRAHVDKT